VVTIVHLFATAMLPGLLLLWYVVKKFVRYISSKIFRDSFLEIFLEVPISLVELVTCNLANLAVCVELYHFQFPEKFFDRNGFDYVCTRYKKLLEITRDNLWVCQTIRSAFRAIVVEKGESVMPTILHFVFTITKMAIHIDNELCIYGRNPGGDWHGITATVVGAIVVVDWGFLAWDGVLGPNLQDVRDCLLGFVIIAGTMMFLAVLRKYGREDLHRHVHWMHCVASFSVPGAQPLVVLASLVVLACYAVKRHQ